jgi:hypothetical protein
MDPRESLFVPMDQKLGKEFKLGADLLQRALVILRQLPQKPILCQ